MGREGKGGLRGVEKAAHALNSSPRPVIQKGCKAVFFLYLAQEKYHRHFEDLGSREANDLTLAHSMHQQQPGFPANNITAREDCDQTSGLRLADASHNDDKK